jgi:hypothetical protein
MIRNLAIVLIAFLIGNGLGMAQERCGAGLAPFVDGATAERLQHIAQLHAKGKESIPVLIREIDNGDVAPVRLENPFLVKTPSTADPYCGVVAAYLIEFILGRPRVSLQALPEPSNLLLQSGPENYPYRLGSIFDSSSRNPVSKEKLSRIAGRYDEWWKANAEKSLDSMREDWMKAKGPLAGSGYSWR